MSLMPPPSPRSTPKRKKQWCTTEESADPNDLELTLTPRHVDVRKSPDRPPMSVVVIQSTSTHHGSPWVEVTNKDRDNMGTPTPMFGSSAWSNVSKLMPRRPLPVSCVSPSSSGERKRRACSIASSSVDEFTYCSPPRPSRKLAPKKSSNLSSFIHRKTPSEESLSRNVMHQAQQTPTKMSADFSMENLSLQSPLARRPHELSRSPSSTTTRRREQGNSFSDYIASPARSLHSSFSDYVPSPALARPKASTADFSSSQGSSCARSATSPRKVPLTVLSQQGSPKKRLLDSFPFKTPDSRKMPTIHYAGSSLLYSPDDEDDPGSSGAVRSIENDMPSPLSRLPPLGRSYKNAMICHGDITISPKDSDHQPSPYHGRSPRKPRPKLNFLSPKTPLPKVSLTPRKSQHGKSKVGLMPRHPLSNGALSTSPSTENGLDLPVSFSVTATRCSPKEDIHTTPPSRSTPPLPPSGTCYPVSPRLLLPLGSKLLSEDPSVGGVDALLNKTIEASAAESLRSNLSYWSDSDDEDEFILAVPSDLKKETAWHKLESRE